MEQARSYIKLQQPFEQGIVSEEVLYREYPNRPHNHGTTWPFYKIYDSLLKPLNDAKNGHTGLPTARKRVGPAGPKNLTPQEKKRTVIQNFVSAWRRDVGPDIYPAFRLLLPHKDKERAMYGLKEKTIGTLLVRVTKINKDSEDAINLLNWKTPGQRSSTMAAGDFAARCYFILSKRPFRTEPGELTIQNVNDKLDELSQAHKEDQQLQILDYFYRRMNAIEMQWLIRIIVRQMRIGATEKTLFDVWHPDADTLFNISSNLRRVCWELADPNLRLASEESDITLMQCFQPQLAQFQMHSFEKMVQRMRPTEDDDEFWIEEKLDGERMQLHMMDDHKIDGGKRFGFWSRKAKDYTYLYGAGFADESCALTKYLRDAFDKDVRNIILDGEMITWDPSRDKMVPFGTLKTAALNERDKALANLERPFFQVFDILYLNDKSLANYTLRDRRRALESVVRPIHRRLEIVQYTVGTSPADIEPRLRSIVAESSEGLVLKNPRSAYRLNDRNDDWMKVKPEYMTGFGQDMDCLIIGGYWGSGRRGGNLSSFMCGLRVHDRPMSNNEESQKFWSFCKVGGGFSTSDYAAIRHHTDGKWHDWDAKCPPSQYIELAGDKTQREVPDTWIKPSDSVVVSIKAASVNETKMFRVGETLRFPRLKSVRTDRKWDDALTYQQFLTIKNEKYREQEDRVFTLEQRRRQKPNKRRKKELVVAGAIASEDIEKLIPQADLAKDLFTDFTFFVITESSDPKKSKHEVEAFAKGHGANISHTAAIKRGTNKRNRIVCIADRNVVKVSSLVKIGSSSIVRPSWLFDCVEQAKRDIAVGREATLLPWEPRHVLFVCEADKKTVGTNSDEFGDPYARDILVLDELRDLLAKMPGKFESQPDLSFNLCDLTAHNIGQESLPAHMFEGYVLWFDDGQSEDTRGTDIEPAKQHFRLPLDLALASNMARFAGGRLSDGLHDESTTHIITGADKARNRALRHRTMSQGRMPILLDADWVHRSWVEQTSLDEERFPPA